MAEYIDREALLVLLGKLFMEPPHQHDGENYYCGIAIARQEIEEIPTADVVEVRHGYWDDCECSVCGKMHPSLYLDEWELEYRIKETPYCPNCGAKMDGKGEGE